jgi:hypothetical protein
MLYTSGPLRLGQSAYANVGQSLCPQYVVSARREMMKKVKQGTKLRGDSRAVVSAKPHRTSEGSKRRNKAHLSVSRTDIQLLTGCSVHGLINGFHSHRHRITGKERMFATWLLLVFER